MGTNQKLDDNDPRVVAFAKYKKTDEYTNTRKWALKEDSVDGSLWAAFVEGYNRKIPDTLELPDSVELATKIYANICEMSMVDVGDMESVVAVIANSLPSGEHNNESLKSLDVNKLAKIFVNKGVCASMAEGKRLAMTTNIS